MWTSEERTTMWHNSYLKPRLFGLDGRAFVVILVSALHLRLWTIETMLGIAGILMFVEVWKGITIEDALRGLRSLGAGSKRPGVIESERRRSVDYGYTEWFFMREDEGIPLPQMNFGKPAGKSR